MALEPAGVSLEAEGFKKYIKNLDDIEKKQRAAFEAEFKGTGKSYAQVIAAAKKYEAELKRLANAEKKAQEESERFVAAQKKEAEAIKKAAEAAKKAADEQRKAGRTQISGGVKNIFSGDIKSGISDITTGLKAVGPAAAVATAGLAAVAVGAVATAAAIGAVAVGAIKVASDTDKATKQIASSLGITGVEAADKYNASLQRIFVDNPEAQFEQIAEAIVLTDRALDGFDSKGIEDVAAGALLISQQFDQDLSKVVGAVEQQVEQFGVSGDKALDLITTGLQTVPADDLLDTLNEYTGVFADAGFAPEQYFATIAAGAQGSILGTDKAADAIKEFNVKFIEGTDDVKKAFATLGLDFDEFARNVEAGTATPADAFAAFIDRAGEVDLSISSNRKAVNALGTQFEDLGSKAIQSLNASSDSFANVTGATDRLNERFNNLGSAFESIKRSALIALSPIGQTVLELANSIVPKIKAAFEAVRPAIDAFAARVVPAFEFGADALGRLGQTLGGVSSGASTFESVLNGVAVVVESIAGGLEILARVAETFRQTLAFARAGTAAFGSIADDVFNALIESFGAVGRAFKSFVSGDFNAGFAELNKEVLNFEDTFDKAGAAAVDAFNDSVFRDADTVKIPVEPEILGGAPGAPPGDTIPDDTLAKPFVLGEKAIKSYQSALSQAENLQRSFTREAEDTALKLARANEDIARKQQQQVAKLGEKQKKDRDKLLDDQIKQLDKFDSDSKKQVAKAESDFAKERKKADDKRKRDKEKLNRDLKAAEDKFNLSRLQSERRFSLSETRLRAEGDILALQQLREDQELQRQEEKENFDISQKQNKESGLEQIKDQAKASDERLKELKSDLEAQRSELLTSFDEQIEAQRQAQIEAQNVQAQAFQEQAAERQIQLQREEEDRRISQARQLEDLGRSLAEQEGVTAEGSAAIAGQLEKVFGIEGTADNIMTGFTTKTENEFSELFKNLEKIITDVDIDKAIMQATSAPSVSTGSGGFGRRIGGVQEFQDGGVVAGPLGSPQAAIVHAGETVLPTHQRSFTMAAPVIPSQSLEVNMSGGFNISGDGQSNDAILQAATAEMTENFRIAVRRLARRN